MKFITGILLLSVLSSCSSSDKAKKEISFPYEISGVKLSHDRFSFGKVVLGEERTDTLYLYNSSGRLLDPTFLVLDDWIHFEQESRFLHPGDTLKIPVRLLSGRSKKYGNNMQRVTFMPDRMDSMCQYFILVTADFIEDFTSMSPKEKEESPVIVWDATEIDFGKVEEGKELVHYFSVSNQGKRDLIIRRVETTCGCTAVVPESRIIKPGDTTRLKIVFYTKGRQGKQLKTIRVTNNDFRAPNTILKVRAHVENKNEKDEK